MLALYRDGRQADALRSFQAYRRHLAEEVGLEPSGELAELERMIAIRDPRIHAWTVERAPPGPQLGVRAESTGSVTDGAQPARRLGVFCFTDIEGSARVWETDRAGMERELARHDELVRSLAVAQTGQVFAHTGDGVGAFFDDAECALVFSVELQRAVDELPFDVRVAIHAGSAEQRADNWFGPTLNRCARLLSIGRGGQVLVSDTVRSLLGDFVPEGVALRDLGSHRLKDLHHAEHVWQVMAAGLRTEFGPLRSLDTVANNLPLHASSFLGRDAEVAAVREAVEAHRLVSLVGPGGIGKTRVALQAAADLSDRWTHGVWFVDLTSVVDGDDVDLAILTTLGYGKRPTLSVRESVVDVLRNHDALLVLDNCEHVVTGATELVGAVLRSCPRVHLLTTSRESLVDPAEHVIRLPPLVDAVELFVERAVEEGGLVDVDDRPAVEAICARLDNLPLAIELAASRCTALSPVELLERLDDALSVLTAKRHDRDRHHTIQETIAWSYELLDHRERDAFDRLSVFAAGFTLGGASALMDADALEPVTSLAAKSMVVAERQQDGTTRDRVLETLRQFGAKHRSARGIDEEVMQRLADLACTFCAAARAGLEGPDEARLGGPNRH